MYRDRETLESRAVRSDALHIYVLTRISARLYVRYLRWSAAMPQPALIQELDKIVRNFRDNNYPTRRWRIVDWVEPKKRQRKGRVYRPLVAASVSIDEFRKTFPRNDLALLLEVAYADQRRGLDVPCLTEAKYQRVWSQSGEVPSDVFAYALRKRRAITALARLPNAAAKWTPQIQRAMVELRTQHCIQETALLMRRKFRIRVTVGVIKGRERRERLR